MVRPGNSSRARRRPTSLTLIGRLIGLLIGRRRRRAEVRSADRGGELDSQGSPAQQEDPAKKRKKPKKEVDDLIDSNGARDKPTAARHGSRAKAAPSKDADFERAIQASQELDITMDCDGTDLTHDGCSKLLAGVQTLPAAQLRDLLICNKFPEPVQAFIGINKDPSLNFPMCIS